MRTRFIATDYSSAVSTVAGGGPIQALDFVQLPLPHFPPNYPSFATDFLHSFGDIPFLDISHEIENLPIDDALSIFLSDVLPHFINRAADFKDRRIDDSRENFEPLPSQGSKKICYVEKELDRLGADKVEIEVTNFKKKDGETSDGIGLLQFEIPATDISVLPSQKCITNSLMESLPIFSEISDPECTMDLLSSELRLYDDLQIQQSVYSVDDIALEYPVEEKADLLEDSGSVEGEPHSQNIKFPLFEVDVESKGIVGRLYIEDELLSFENVYKEKTTEPDVVSNNELLGSLEFDFMKNLLHPCVAVQSLGDTKFSLQLDNIGLIELSNIHDYSAFHHMKQDNDSIWCMDSILVDEIMFLDLDPYNFHDVFSDAAEKIAAVTCESMFTEAMHFKSFNELIVCHELTPMDDSFKSLPVPIFSDHKNTSSLYSLMEEVFAQLDCQSYSASDGLYLDWDYLTEEDGYFVKYPSCWKTLWELNSYKIDADMNLSDSEKVIFDFILSEVDPDEKHAENYKGMPKLHMFHSLNSDADSNCLTNNGDGKRTNEEHLLKTSVEKVPVFGESMSSDLEFFLNPRNYNAGRVSVPSDKSVDTNTMCQVITSIGDSNAGYGNTVVQQKEGIKLHHVKLSDNILLLINHLGKNFLTLLKDKKELVLTRHQYQAANDLTLLHIPKENLMSQLKGKIVSSTYLVHDDDDIILLAMLCAIKQMAFYLCYYGVQATYVYMDKLSKSLQCMKSRLSSLCGLIRNEHEKAEKEPRIIHPSISIVRDILLANLSNNSSKILIVSDQVFWHSLKSLMTSLKISYSEQQHHHGEITDTTVDIILCSDCCLLSHDYVSATFPFSKFSCILEYGGSNGSSRISSICPKLDGLPIIYFLTVDLGESTIAEALTHGVDMPKSLVHETKRDLESTSAQQERKLTLEELLNTLPVEETHPKRPVEAAKEDDNCTMVPAEFMPLGSESKENLSCETFLPGTIIIVNTRNFNEEMVISRRSTYQRILEMEKEGAQVVERDVSLPVDVIVSAAICLTWYNSRNIGKKASAPDEAFSCLALCAESIAANILTSLSFAFSCCILIFEGEDHFLGSIMESSDELYAAAASLGIDIQVFYSCSSEMTEQIILSCISVSAKSSRSLYPKMWDSESLAEYFLTAFPSINPLSAHAILSSGDVLGKFLEMSKECRIHALQQYQVPDESVSLLSTTSKYGEREDSKSGMTDCSSSVSSLPESENVQFKSASNRKKPKYSHNLYSDAEPPDDLFHMGSLNLFPDDKLNPPKLSVSCNSWLSGASETSEKPGKFSLPFSDNIFSHSQEFGVKGLEISEEREKSWMPRTDLDCSPGWRSMTAAMNKFSKQSMQVPGTPQDGFTGEVINVEDSPVFREKISVSGPSTLSPFLLEVEKDYAARNSRISKLTSGANKVPIDFDAASDSWISRKDKGENLMEENKQQFATIERKDTSMKFRKGLLEEDVIEVGPSNSYRPSFQEKGIRSSGSTPFSNALHSTQLQQGSPWTMEFLNRIREKSRLRKQLVSYNLSSPCFDSSGNTKNIKRKSPSKIVREKRQKRSSQPLNSLKDEKASTSCTPVDKRARGTLSFSTNGTGGQSKLVWRDNNSLTGQRRF